MRKKLTTFLSDLQIDSFLEVKMILVLVLINS